MYSSTTLLSSTATGLRSLAKASAPTRSASSGIEPPPANGSTTSGRVPGSPPRASWAAWVERAAGVQVLADGRVVPVGEVGDEVEQGEPELVQMGRVVRVESDPFRLGCDNSLRLAEALLRGLAWSAVVL